MGVIFLAVKTAGYVSLINGGFVPSDSTFAALYFLLTGVHALHVLGGVAAAGHFAFHGTRATAGDPVRLANAGRAIALYWYFVDAVWLCVLAAFYLL